MTTRKIHTATFKAQVVQQVLREDKTLAQIAALQGLPTIIECGDGAQTADKAAHEKQTEKLYEQIGRLTTQLAWIKKKSGLDAEPK